MDEAGNLIYFLFFTKGDIACVLRGYSKRKNYGYQTIRTQIRELGSKYTNVRL
jgi:hypothetical protein